MKPLPQTLQKLGQSLWYFSMCLLYLICMWNCFSHFSHWITGVQPRLLCTDSCPRERNFAGHLWHLRGFSPVWVRKCSISKYLSFTTLWHNKQLKPSEHRVPIVCHLSLGLMPGLRFLWTLLRAIARLVSLLGEIESSRFSSVTSKGSVHARSLFAELEFTSSKCILMTWCLRDCLMRNFFGQKLQGNGFSPVCTRTCSCSLQRDSNFLLHCAQKCFLVDSSFWIDDSLWLLEEGVLSFLVISCFLLGVVGFSSSQDWGFGGSVGWASFANNFLSFTQDGLWDLRALGKGKSFLQPRHLLCDRTCTLRPNCVSNTFLQNLQVYVFPLSFRTVSCSVDSDSVAVIFLSSLLCFSGFSCSFPVKFLPLLLGPVPSVRSVYSSLMSWSNFFMSFLTGGRRVPWAVTGELPPRVRLCFSFNEEAVKDKHYKKILLWPREKGEVTVYYVTNVFNYMDRADEDVTFKKHWATFKPLTREVMEGPLQTLKKWWDVEVK